MRNARCMVVLSWPEVEAVAVLPQAVLEWPANIERPAAILL